MPQPGSVLATRKSELVFLIRPQGGLTRLLAKHAASEPEATTRVLLDGPYGGVDMQQLHRAQRQLVIAGGSGAGWILPIIIAFLRRHKAAQRSERSLDSPSLMIVLATRDISTRLWFEDQVRILLKDADLADIPVKLHIKLCYTGSLEGAESHKATGQRADGSSHPEKAPDLTQVKDLSSDSDSASGSSIPFDLEHINGRPDLHAAVKEEVELAESKEETGVFVCGPLGMQHDVAEAVAAEQFGQKSVSLHLEHFSWA